MKKIKYLLNKSKRQKTNIPFCQSSDAQYISTLKNQALKSLYNLQQDYLNKTQLNITLKNTQRSEIAYRSRSEQKQNMKKTYLVKNSYDKSNKNALYKKENYYDSSSINVKKLLKIKTQAQQQQNHKLKNPFYKIQKARLIPKKFSLVDHQQPLQPKQLINIQQNNSLSLKNQNQFAQNKQQNPFLISRQKRQWYFASKKFRSRTLQNDQRLSAKLKIELNHMKSPITNHVEKSIRIMEKSSTKGFSRKESKEKLNIKDSQQILEFKISDSILNQEDNIIAEASRQQSPDRIRQKSLTIKYNEIKDYFEKKYAKNNQQIEEFSTPYCDCQE